MSEPTPLQRCAEFDMSDYPLIRVAMQKVEITDYNFQLYLNELTTLYVAKNDIYILFDLRPMRIPSLRYQRMMADWVRDHSSIIQMHCVACATIVGNSLLRAVAELVNTMFRVPTSYEIFTQPAEAEEWLKTKMRTTR